MITIDEYYDVNFYKQCIEALKNNGTEFKEFISIKSPFKWYLELPSDPIMLNYDKLPKQNERFLINKVIPTTPNSEYLLTRRDDTGTSSLIRYTENEPFKECRLNNSGVFFHVKNKEELVRISKEFPGKLWFLGKYYSNKFNVCLTYNNMIKNYIMKENILLENTEKEPGRFEADFNYFVLKLKDMIIKYDETPYAFKGSYVIPKVFGNRGPKFILV